VNYNNGGRGPVFYKIW